MTKREKGISVKFRIVGGVLCKVVTEGPVERNSQCIPRLMRKAVMTAAHDLSEAGHLGEAKTIASVIDKYWWYKMARDIRIWIAICSSCQPFKPDKTGRQGYLERTIATHVGGVGSIDYIGPTTNQQEETAISLFTSITSAGGFVQKQYRGRQRKKQQIS